MALNIFPSDVASELKSFAEKASLHCAKARFGNKGEADAANIEAGQHYDRFKEKSEGLLSNFSCDNIRCMLWRAAWHAANTRMGDNAEKDKQMAEEHYQEVIKKGEVSKTLLTNVRKMGWDTAWFVLNTICGFHDDVVRDRANVGVWFAKMQGEANLVAMNFIMDEAETLSKKPKVVAEETLENNGDIQQTMAFKFSVTEGRTSSVSHKIGFKYGIKQRFSASFVYFSYCAGFIDVARFGFEVSFNFSDDCTFSESTNTGTTKWYEFPLSVPARTTYVAKGIVHEAQMEVPYELVFDVGGVKRSVKGIWKGVAVSKATYHIDTK